MKKTDSEITKACVFCEYGTEAPDDGSGRDAVICSKRGIVRGDGCCRSFRYDLLKRDPKRTNGLPEFSPVDLDD